MKFSLLSSWLTCIYLFSILNITPTFAIKKSYIVYLGSHSHGSDPTSADKEQATDSHHEFLGSFLGCKEKAKQSITYSYNQHINGFAATLEEKEADEIAKHEDVISVFENKFIKTQTTYSWNFLGMEKDSDIPLDSLWKKANFGDGIIIGNIDTGIWPESQSFSDEGMGPVPSRWRGICQTGFREDGSSDEIKCNKKLIGVRYFSKGLMDLFGSANMTLPSNYTLLTVRDGDGHGTHTLSTAGGNFVSNVSMMGNGNGTAKGGSPKARVAAYKAIWAGMGGTDADFIAAFDAAIYDGVDVLSVSAGSFSNSTEYFEQGIAIGAFHAIKHGIVVVAAASNNGPLPSTVENYAPWMLTVAASSTDRDFLTHITLGNGKQLKGPSLSFMSLPSQTFAPLFTATDDNNLISCADRRLADPKKFSGKLLVCRWPKLNEVRSSLHKTAAATTPDKSQQFQFGVIIVNDNGTLGEASGVDLMGCPMSQINFPEAESLLAYINSTKNPVAHLTRAMTEFKTKPSPMVAEFSSRGPSRCLPDIIKPDITAPGVNIIAANFGVRYPYKIMSGTSMSCPHVAGIAALLKVIHPHWTPAAIKSAIMTTATTKDTSSRPILNRDYKEATPFDYGSGHVRPDLAADPGLVYDLSVVDYLNLLCAHGYKERTISLFYPGRRFECPKSSSIADLNYPSIGVSDFKDSITFTRRLKNVGTPGTYNVTIEELAGVSAEVEPKSLTFERHNEEKTFKLVLKRNGSGKSGGGYVFGGLTWYDGFHHVRSPIAVKL